MATAFHIDVAPNNSGLLEVKQTEAAASKVSQLLQHDLEAHHVFFNASGFHNHIPHHLLSLYGTGSSPEFIQKAYDANTSYQIKAQRPRSNVVDELHKDYDASSKAYLGKGKHYADFLQYFQAEIEDKGWQAVLLEHVFGDDAKSRDLFARLYAGFLHPMIQLMYGIEWQQPAMVAEGLAQAAVHEDRLSDVLAQTETAAAAEAGPRRSLAELIEGVRDNEALATSANWDDANRVYDGVVARAGDEAVRYVAQIRVAPEELEERTAEMVHTAAWLAVAAAFRPPHIPKLDFFLIHHLTSTPIFLAINKLPWVPTAHKVRLLEYKMRLDVIQYAARGCPALVDLGAALGEYTPRDGNLVERPEDLLPRFHAIVDDGHTIKVVRALLLAQKVSAPCSGRPWVRIPSDDAWLKMHYVLLDSVEGQNDRWVRSAGFPEAWENIPTKL